NLPVPSHEVLSMRMRFLTVLATLGLLAAGPTARADYQFIFTDSTGTAASSFSVSQGSTIDIRVYLAETGTTTLPDTRLSDGGVKLTYDQSIAKVANASAITPNGAFDFASKSTGVNFASLNLTQDGGSSPVAAPSSGADANRILLGTFTFTGISAGSTTA